MTSESVDGSGIYLVDLFRCESHGSLVPETTCYSLFFLASLKSAVVRPDIFPTTSLVLMFAIRQPVTPRQRVP